MKKKDNMKEFGDGIGWALMKYENRKRHTIFLAFTLGIVIMVYGLLVGDVPALLAGTVIFSTSAFASIVS
jgi:hypothetical protein